jgi:hypothetical protein
VPRICEFHGIVIRMFHDDHGPPHFHAEAEGRKAVFSLGGELLRGRLSVRAIRLVERWAELRHVELQQNWARARAHARLVRIRPLE